MSATATSPWPPWMLEPGPWWPWPPQGLIPLPVPVSLGGTGVTTGPGALEVLGVNGAIQSAIQQAIDALPPGQSFTLPLTVANGGTGATTAPAALLALGVNAAITAALTDYLPLAGNVTITGPLTLDDALDLSATASLTVDAAATATINGTLNIDGPLFVTDGTTLQPVTIGAADTGDTGFRVLQVPN